MTQFVLIEETSAVKTETKADKRKREAALKKQEKEALKKKQAAEKAEKERIEKEKATRWHRTNKYSPWPEYPANYKNRQSN